MKQFFLVVGAILFTGVLLNYMGNSKISMLEKSAKYVTAGYGV